MIARARAVSLRLPGQSLRAHRDYQSRLLTDAVMTAIAVQEPFADEFLEGLLPLLRHGAAIGLWQLVVAATSTTPENVIRDAAREALSAEESVARRRLLLVAEALDEEVAWHSPGRFQVAANLARDMLSGANARANEQMLYEQRAKWDAIRQKLRHDVRDSPQTVETSVVVIMAGMAGLLAPVPGRGQARGLPAFPAPRGRSGLRGQGRPARAVARRAMRSTLEAGGAAPYP